MESAELTIWSVGLWWFAAVVKFVVTPSAMVASGHSVWTTWCITSSGAAIGVWGFWNFGKWWFQWIEERLGERQARGKRVFTAGRRRLVRLKNTMGLTGLLMVSGLISVPIASVVAAKYYREAPYAKHKLMLAFAVWAALLTVLTGIIKSGLT